MECANRLASPVVAADVIAAVFVLALDSEPADFFALLPPLTLVAVVLDGLVSCFFPDDPKAGRDAGEP